MKKRLPKYLQLNKFIIFYLVALFIGSSCARGLRIEKRKYNKGFYTSKTKGNSSNKEVNRNSNNKTLLYGFSNKHPKNEYLETNTKPNNNRSLLANSEKNVFSLMSQSAANKQSNTEFNITDRPFDKNGIVFTAPYTKNDLIQIFNSDSSLITLKWGGEIKCKVIGINKNTIRFRSNPDKNNVYSIKTKTIEKIECYNIDSNFGQTVTHDSLVQSMKLNVLNDDNKESKYSMIFGIASIVSILSVFGIPLIAIFCPLAIYYGLKVKRRNSTTNKKYLKRVRFGLKTGSFIAWASFIFLTSYLILITSLLIYLG